MGLKYIVLVVFVSVVCSCARIGIGIAEENLELIFQPFSRLNKSLTRESDGVGVGLGISSPRIDYTLLYLFF